MKNTLIVFCALLLASCSDVPVEVGSGPIKLSDEAQAAYEEYSSSRRPIVFVVSHNGKLFQYNYCEEARCLRRGGTARAIAECEAMGDGRRCFVYDREGTIVWDQQRPFKNVDDIDILCSQAFHPPEQRVRTCSETLAIGDLPLEERAAAHRRRARAYAELENYEKAVHDLSAVLDDARSIEQLGITDRSLAHWYLDRGRAYESLGDLKEAKTDFERAVQRNPTLSAAKDALSRVDG